MKGPATDRLGTGTQPGPPDLAATIRRPASPNSVGLVTACGAVLLYTAGLSRAFSFDGSRTVGQFVTAETLGDVFRQDRFNNHPLFSLLEHLVHLATGSTDERVLRLVPIACGALAVGLVAAAVARRFGTVAGLIAGATLAVNSMAVRQFREVRGYALVTLAAVVATLVLFKRLRRPNGWLGAGYAISAAIAIGTHLFGAGLLVLHALIVLAVGPARLRSWLGPWALALWAGLAVQLPAIVDGLDTPPQSHFDPTFPLRFAANLLGGPALPGMLLLVLVGWRLLRPRRWVTWVLVGTALMVVACWIAAPTWLDSRFFIWLAPATAVAAGVAAGSSPRLLALAAACVLVQVVAVLPGISRSDVPNRTAAAFARAARNQGSSVCALGRTRAGLLAYVDDVPAVWDFTQLHECDVAVEAAGPKIQPLLGAACERFAYVLTLPAKHPGAIFADRTLPLVPELLANASYEDHRWSPTTSADVCRDAPFPQGLVPARARQKGEPEPPTAAGTAPPGA